MVTLYMAEHGETYIQGCSGYKHIHYEKGSISLQHRESNVIILETKRRVFAFFVILQFITIIPEWWLAYEE